jgi:HD superfamily phosphohydrolase YqeK
MGPLALALYVADKIEPDRDQPGVEDLRKLALKDLRRAATAALEDSTSYNEQSKAVRATRRADKPWGG